MPACPPPRSIGIRDKESQRAIKSAAGSAAAAASNSSCSAHSVETLISHLKVLFTKGPTPSTANTFPITHSLSRASYQTPLTRLSQPSFGREEVDFQRYSLRFEYDADTCIVTVGSHVDAKAADLFANYLLERLKKEVEPQRTIIVGEIEGVGADNSEIDSGWAEDDEYEEEEE